MPSICALIVGDRGLPEDYDSTHTLEQRNFVLVDMKTLAKINGFDSPLIPLPDSLPPSKLRPSARLAARPPTDCLRRPPPHPQPKAARARLVVESETWS